MQDLSPDEVANPSERCRASLKSLVAAAVVVRRCRASGDAFGSAFSACFLPATPRSSTAFPGSKV